MILDTNTYGALQDAKPELVELVRLAQIIYLPVNVVAELQAGFVKGTRREQNEQIFQQFISRPGVEIIHTSQQTATYYAELQALCWRRGRSLSNNDVWIAAFTQEYDETLVTYDQDFEVFRELLGDNLIILR